VESAAQTSSRATQPARYPSQALLVLPATRWELPGCGKLGKWFGVWGADNDARWRNAPRKSIRGKWHHYLMDLDLADWSERQT
jgi:hypothetical protein